VFLWKDALCPHYLDNEGRVIFGCVSLRASNPTFRYLFYWYHHTFIQYEFHFSERITQPEYVCAKFGCSRPNLNPFFQWRTAFCELVAFKFHSFHFLCLLVSIDSFFSCSIGVVFGRMLFPHFEISFFCRGWTFKFRCWIFFHFLSPPMGFVSFFVSPHFLDFVFESTKFWHSIVWLFDIITVTFQYFLGFFLRRGLAFHFRHFVFFGRIDRPLSLDTVF